MSWSLILTCDRSLEERDVVRVLSDLSGKDVSKFPQRQGWGWSSFYNGLGVDVDLPVGPALRLCGADYSAHLAEDVAEKVASGLRSLGYEVRKGGLSQ